MTFTIYQSTHPRKAARGPKTATAGAEYALIVPENEHDAQLTDFVGARDSSLVVSDLEPYRHGLRINQCVDIYRRQQSTFRFPGFFGPPGIRVKNKYGIATRRSAEQWRKAGLWDLVDIVVPQVYRLGIRPSKRIIRDALTVGKPVIPVFNLNDDTARIGALVRFSGQVGCLAVVLCSWPGMEIKLIGRERTDDELSARIRIILFEANA